MDQHSSLEYHKGGTKMKLKSHGITRKLYNNYEQIYNEIATPRGFIRDIYTYVAEQLYFNGGYEVEEIKYFFNHVYEDLSPDYYQDESYYQEHHNIDEYIQYLMFEDMTGEQIDNLIKHRYNDKEHDKNEGISTDLDRFKKVVMEYLPEDNQETTENDKVTDATREQNHAEIRRLLKKLDTGEIDKKETKEGIKSQLVDLLEQEEQMFSVDFPDERQPDGFKSKYYYIDPQSKSYKRNTKTHLKQLFKDNYGVNFHKGNTFYYNLLERINTHREEQKQYIEMENVYINRVTYEVIEKTTNDDIFTTDRLTYTTYDTNQERLYKYDPDIRLDDVLELKGRMSYPMKKIYEIFVPKTKPEETNKLRMFMQYMGMIVTGQNTSKLLLLLYDLENKDGKTGSRGRTSLFKMLDYCFNGMFIPIKKNTLKDNFHMDTLKRARHGVFMDEMDDDVFIKFHTEIKSIVNGSGTGGSAMYTREEIKIDSLPFLIGMNGIPTPPLFDTAFLNRIHPIELPNKFVDEKDVKDNTNTYPKINNLDNIIKQHIEELGQVISIGLNEFKALDHTRSLDNQFAIPPNIDRTIQKLTQDNVVLGLLKLYTRPKARGTSIKNDWITTDQILSTIGKAYKKSTGHAIDPHEVDNKKVGMLLLQIYPTFLKEKGNKKQSNDGKIHYNLTLLTTEEVKQEQNETMEVFPVPDNKKLMGREQTIYNLIKNGVNSKEELYNEIDEEPEEINEILITLYNKGVMDWTGNQRLK